MNSLFATFVMTGIVGAAVAGCGAGGASGEDAPLGATGEGLTFHTSGRYDGNTGNPTQCTINGVQLHCCVNPPGILTGVMIGAQVDQNVFKCGALSSLNPAAPGAVPFLDGPGQPTFTMRQNNIHACPAGSVMDGFNEYYNLLSCIQMKSPKLVERLDPGISPTEDAYPMHVCSSAGIQAMTGIRVDRNDFLCSR